MDAKLEGLLLGVIESIERAGKGYRRAQGESDIQCLRIVDVTARRAFSLLMEEAKRYLDGGSLPDYDRTHFDIGYQALKEGTIRVTN